MRKTIKGGVLMAYIKAKMQCPNFVQVPTWFITDYMPKALGGYSKVYLYLLTLTMISSDASIDLEKVCSELDMLFSELLKALNYWNDKKILHFEILEDDHYELEFYMNKPIDQKPTMVAKNVTSATTKTIIRQTRPEYRTDEINLYLQDSKDVAQLFKLAEQYLGRLLTISDQKILFSLYDWLHMPFDLIEFLIEYCVSSNHKAMHYIEKVAINWVDEGIITLEQAKAKTLSDKRYFKILNSLGSSKSILTTPEKNLMDKWLNTYKFSMEIILKACERTVEQANKPSLKYVESILSSWHADNVTSLADIEALDKAYESKRLQQNTTKTLGATTLSNKVTKFNSMYTHDWDFDELEKLEEAHLTKELNGGK